MPHLSFMEMALGEARDAAGRGEVPVGAILVNGSTGEVLAHDGNRMEELHDPTAHAEMRVIRRTTAGRGETHLENCDLYVTLEPCAMCAQAISLARIRRLYFGAYDPKSGGVDHGARVFDHATCHHKPEVVGGLAEADCAKLLKEFFRERR